MDRDRCVLKDRVYWGEGNRELQPHGHVVEVWAENPQNVTLDCGGSVGKNVFTADRPRARSPPSRGPCPSTASSRGYAVRAVRGESPPVLSGKAGIRTGDEDPNGGVLARGDGVSVSTTRGRTGCGAVVEWALRLCAKLRGAPRRAGSRRVGRVGRLAVNHLRARPSRDSRRALFRVSRVLFPVPYQPAHPLVARGSAACALTCSQKFASSDV